VGGLAASFAIIFIITVALAGLSLAVVKRLPKAPGDFYDCGHNPIALYGPLTFTASGRAGWGGERHRVRPAPCGSRRQQVHSGVPRAVLQSYKNQLVMSIALCSFIASVLPVWMLLCPRDYLSTYEDRHRAAPAVRVVFIARHQMPAVTTFVHGGGPVIPGKLFPFMFITIACGIVSGSTP
jgi:carbon starvation protein